MAQICNKCGRGVGYGHAVSHAKNRTRRLFKPNLQKLKVLKDGIAVRVRLCTNCIQRLKRDRQYGPYKLKPYLKAKQEIKEAVARVAKIEIPAEEIKKESPGKKEEEMKIEDIVGKSR